MLDQHRVDALRHGSPGKLAGIRQSDYLRVMRLFWSITLLALCTSGAINANRVDQARTVFRAHDPNGRLPHTKIERRGTVRTYGSEYAIYYLNFTNPLSHHGQQRIAIIKNGRKFMGAYQCTLGKGRWDATMVIKKDRIRVFLNSSPKDPRFSFEIRFTKRGPSHNRYFCGEGSGWENGI
jgi:hypothetical protein